MTDGLFTQDLDGDLVVLDETTQHIHLLTGDAAAQWAELGSDRRTFLRQAGTVAVAGTVITIGLPLASAAASGMRTVATDTSVSCYPERPLAGSSFQIPVTIRPQPSGGTLSLTRDGALVSSPQDASSGSVTYTLTAGAAFDEDVFIGKFNGYTSPYPTFYATSQGQKTVRYRAAPTLTQETLTTRQGTQPMVVTVVGASGGPVPGGTLRASTTHSSAVLFATEDNGDYQAPLNFTLDSSGKATVYVLLRSSLGSLADVTFTYIGDTIGDGDANYVTKTITSTPFVVTNPALPGAPVEFR